MLLNHVNLLKQILLVLSLCRYNCVPEYMRDKQWTPFTYCYKTQISMFKEEKTLNLEFSSDWILEEVEKYIEDMFEKMKVNYYESWSGERRTMP